MKRRPPKGNVRRVVHVNKNIRTEVINQQGEAVQTESLQELTFFDSISRRKDVHRIVSQPFTLEFKDGGNLFHYTPDFMIFLSDGTIEIHEITVTARQENASSKRRQEAMRLYCQQKGWVYVIHTEKTLPSVSVRHNLDLLSGYEALAYCNNAICEQLNMLVLTSASPITIGQARKHICDLMAFPLTLFEETLFHLLWHGQLSVNLQQLLVVRGKLVSNITIELPQH